MSENHIGDSPEWQQLVAGQDQSRAADLYSALVTALDGSDVSFLISTVEIGDEREKIVSLALLRQILTKRKEVVTAHQRDELGKAASTLLSSYPQTTGLNAFYLLQALIPDRAEEYLLHDVELEKLDDKGISTFLANLALFPSARVSEKLLQLSQVPGRIGELAEMYLQHRGLMSEQKLKIAADTWRKKRSRAALNQLYTGFVSHQMGRPVNNILELLGVPSEQKDNRYWYHSADGITLFLESDAEGTLKSAKIK